VVFTFDDENGNDVFEVTISEPTQLSATTTSPAMSNMVTLSGLYCPNRTLTFTFTKDGFKTATTVVEIPASADASTVVNVPVEINVSVPTSLHNQYPSKPVTYNIMLALQSHLDFFFH